MDVREPKCIRCEYSGVCNVSKNLYCKCEVCKQYVKDHPYEDDDEE